VLIFSLARSLYPLGSIIDNGHYVKFECGLLICFLQGEDITTSILTVSRPCYFPMAFIRTPFVISYELLGTKGNGDRISVNAPNIYLSSWIGVSSLNKLGANLGIYSSRERYQHYFPWTPTATFIGYWK